MSIPSLGAALPLDQFWRWLLVHNDCIVRAGTGDAALHDHDDLHWRLREEPGGQRLVQLMRGKDVLGQMSIASAEVAYVEMHPSLETQGHFEFQLLGESGSEMQATHYFVLGHAYEEEPENNVARH